MKFSCWRLKLCFGRYCFKCIDWRLMMKLMVDENVFWGEFSSAL